MNLMLFPASQHRASDVPSDAELARYIEANAIAAGRAYAQSGRVLQLQVSDDGTKLTAETQGSRRKPYAQTIVLQRDNAGQLRVVGICSCPRHTNCKHVAAVLLVARGRHRLGPPAPSVQSELLLSAGQGIKPPRETPLDQMLLDWLGELESAQQSESGEYPATVRQRLFYVLHQQMRLGAMPRLGIRPIAAQLRKADNALTNHRDISLRQAVGAQAPRFLRAADKLILRRLARDERGDDADEDPQDTLRRIIATGRAHWGSMQGPVVTEGPARPGKIVWQVRDDGSQLPMVELDEPPDSATPVVVLRVPEPWYVETASGTMGLVTLGMPAPVVDHLLDVPPVAAEHAARLRGELQRRIPDLAVPPPAELPPPILLQDPPRPHLMLVNGPATVVGGYSRQHEPHALPLARLRFDYGPFTIEQDERRTTLARNGQLFRLQRQRRDEERHWQRLQDLGFVPMNRMILDWRLQKWGRDLMLPGDADGAAWLRMMLHEFPKLRDEGWTIEIAPDFPMRLAEPESEISATLEAGSGIDWLELHLGVTIDGERVDLVPPLVAMITAAEMMGYDLAVKLQDAGGGDEPFLVPLADGRFVPLPMARIRPILSGLIELFARGGIDPEADGAVRFTRLDAADVAALEAESGVTWQGGEALRSLGARLRESGNSIPAVTVPDSFRGALRAYQAQGVNWLQFLRDAGLGGVLADDMGLGKTVQTLAHLAVEQAAGRLERPCLIVCPTSVLPNWASEAARFAPALRLLILHGPLRKDLFPAIPRHDLVITTYPLLARDHAVLTAQEWHVVVLDEAQMIKNPNAETTRQALRLKATQRLCLSGTPLQNHLGELWSLFDFLAPGFLGSARSFRTRFRTPIEKHGDRERADLLTKRVRPFLLRRTKEEVVQELPPKTEITEQVAMEEPQRAVYESIRMAMHARVRQAIAEKGLAQSGIIILDALLKLRQACCDPRLLKMKTATRGKPGSAKLERLMDLLGVMLPEGRRILLFSQFTEMLALIAEKLTDTELPFVTLTGDTKDRATPVRRFQSGEVPLFLISLKAGGVGLNLTAADTVVHYDPWWNPAVEEQATDRAYRIGQDKPVFVHRLVTLGTIEEKMEQLKEKKRALVATVMAAANGGALSMTEADVEALLGPA